MDVRRPPVEPVTVLHLTLPVIGQWRRYYEAGSSTRSAIGSTQRVRETDQPESQATLG